MSLQPQIQLIDDSPLSSCSHLSSGSDSCFPLVPSSDEKEEQDMANCLILLANGEPISAEIYTCKTCDKTFPSFQALGGHRASHKKVIKPPSPPKDSCTILSLGSFEGVWTNKSTTRVHECSICGVAFTSGQALGGHMRRHRPLPSLASKKARNGLSLDLNLPAPEDHQDHKEAMLQQVIVFSTSPFVDCQY